MRRPGSATDPHWYKDAIIYELHVRAFHDSNNDGIGDFGGLIQKLDYLQDLGVTCLWLLPFFPSPLRDDGYDIADYTSVHPTYGTLADFQTFLGEAHERGLQVMIELVLNHTSDAHPWFQAARLAPPGSPEREFYVWSDTDQRYRDARIIFTDTEKSNWTWDPVAKAYYWHRFFSHQPDLNFDNPAVVDEMVRVMRFWLDLGVDGLRLDAIPYLVERDATSCENLPETHAVIKRIRREMDAEHENRVILAEANQWPVDVRPYFGDGDECHMAFHFPLMPRIFMALRLEDRLPITDVMAQTPDIPVGCQWGLFLRNHDELTLEMVSDEERDYMYLAYSADPRMRLNIGIRRRLAPLMDNNRRRIELLNSLLFSFPGTPIVYYGDEIGMGDNIYLGDRNGVRTPMQWNADRNAGFSRATPAKLFSPVVMDPVYGYEAINVEAQQGDASSLLSWMRNMIALRKLFSVFGRGSFEMLLPGNRKVLAYIRRHEDDRVLCVANLSRFAQPVTLDLSAMEGMTPVEMLGYVEFPPVGREPYQLTLAPYGFLWFELHQPAETVEVVAEDAGVAEAPLDMTGGWPALFEGAERGRLESIALPAFLPRQRWFGGKARTISATSIIDWGELPGVRAVLTLIEVRYEDGGSETYFAPFAVSTGPEADRLRDRSAGAVVAVVSVRGVSGVLADGLFDPAVCDALLACIERGGDVRMQLGTARGAPGAALADVLADLGERPAVVAGSAEQSNSSIRFGDRLILKTFRRQEAGPNPDEEIDRYLTDVARFPYVPPYAGAIGYVRGAAVHTLAILQRLVPNEGDGWEWTLEELQRYYEHCSAQASLPPDDEAGDAPPDDVAARPPTAAALDHVGIYLDSAATLGRRTAEMHLALARNIDDPAFAPEPMTATDLGQLEADLRTHAAAVFDVLKQGLAGLPNDVVERAGLVLGRRRSLLRRFETLPTSTANGWRLRIHGDYHLGQVLRTRGDYVILDFEGEPARPLAARRAKQSPLRDVAGMLRSFSYAGWAALLAYTARRPDSLGQLEPWERLWERATSAAFLRAYLAAMGESAWLPPEPAILHALLDAFLLDKALYELLYEMNNRPSWVRIPLEGVLTLHA
jgi:maltose alpha-D-glucosyltransferase/alpha-amylase